MPANNQPAWPSRANEKTIPVPAVKNSCDHLGLIHASVPSAAGCEDCLKTGDTWVNLRICMTCGHVGCCDDSQNKHATAHYHATHHPIIQSFMPGETWMWCYVDKVLLE